MHIRDWLGVDARACCERLLLRTLQALHEHASKGGVDVQALHEHASKGGVDVRAAFGDCLQTASCIDNPSVGWSPGEPAVNVYIKGGEFKPHEDEQRLSILVPLTDERSFSGGGTAFWSLADRGPEDEQNQRTVTCPARLVLTPPSGSAIVFGGQVTHAAQPVLSGERCIFVGSFSATAPDAMDAAAATTERPPDAERSQSFGDLGLSEGDGYDYGQHMREIDPAGVFIPRAAPPSESPSAAESSGREAEMDPELWAALNGEEPLHAQEDEEEAFIDGLLSAQNESQPPSAEQSDSDSDEPLFL